MSVIISNTTPINYLVLIDQINVLRHLYAHVMIPQAVFGSYKMKARLARSKHGWLHIQNGLKCERYRPHSTPCLRLLMWANAKRLA
jgi:predicted nucleic acid-binding protein